MKLREYEYITMIAREGNMTRAAEQLYISQPALSRLLQNVESQLGASIFERHGKQMVPTPIGKIYIQNAEKMLLLKKQMIHQLETALKQKQNTLSIGVPLLHINFITKYVLPLFNHSFPYISVELCNCGSFFVSDAIRQKMHHLALAVLTKEIANEFSYTIIGQQRMVVCVSKNHPLIEQAVQHPDKPYPTINSKQLENYSFTLSQEHTRSGKFSLEYFQKHAISPGINCVLPNTVYVYSSVASSDAIAFLPNIPPIWLDLEGKIQYLMINDEQQIDTMAIIYTKDHELTLPENYFIEQLRNSFQSFKAIPYN